ncbi:hypothetical protein AWH04_04090 [Rhodococcus erythropolis]|uniref:hypothetical protein n=1 Tax=Rhodococcus sp. WY5 TaxID=2708349 RepID=UPI000E4D4D6F|nr:hypothetical protein [Rhodococcus sp. WY5]RGP46550.1 hypothetical protein AWH04_04090 [Rhodococcus erythropolis]
MAEWSTWIQLVLSAGLGGGITGSAAFYAARFAGKTATVNAEKDRDHQMVIKQKELDAKQHSETLTRAVDLVADVVSTTTKIERERLAPLNLQLREYREISARQVAIEPEFYNPANNFANRGETPDERRLQRILLESGDLNQRIAQIAGEYSDTAGATRSTLAEFDLLLVRAALLTPSQVSTRIKELQKAITELAEDLQYKPFDEDDATEIDLDSIDSAKAALIEATETWIGGVNTGCFPVPIGVIDDVDTPSRGD